MKGALTLSIDFEIDRIICICWEVGLRFFLERWSCFRPSDYGYSNRANLARCQSSIGLQAFDPEMASVGYHTSRRAIDEAACDWLVVGFAQFQTWR